MKVEQFIMRKGMMFNRYTVALVTELTHDCVTPKGYAKGTLQIIRVMQECSVEGFVKDSNRIAFGREKLVGAWRVKSFKRNEREIAKYFN